MALEQKQSDSHADEPMTLSNALRLNHLNCLAPRVNGRKAKDNLVWVKSCQSCPPSTVLSIDIYSIFLFTLY